MLNQNDFNSGKNPDTITIDKTVFLIKRDFSQQRTIEEAFLNHIEKHLAQSRYPSSLGREAGSHDA